MLHKIASATYADVLYNESFIIKGPMFLPEELPSTVPRKLKLE
jgi:hypothetical protein